MNISLNYTEGPFKAGDYVINLERKELEALELMMIKLYKDGELIPYSEFMEQMVRQIQMILLYQIEKEEEK